MRLVAVDPSEVAEVRSKSRRNSSRPLIREFMKSGNVIAGLEMDDMKPGELQNLYSSLRLYAQANGQPVKVFRRKGQIFLERKDLNDDGTPNPNWEDDDEDEDDDE